MHPGFPSAGRIAAALVGAAGAMNMLCSLVFAIAGGAHEPWMAPVLVGIMLVFWAPAEYWSVWWISVPVVLLAGLLGAFITHRYRRPARELRTDGIDWRHALCRTGVVVMLVSGGWSIVLGALFLLDVIQRAE